MVDCNLKAVLEVPIRRRLAAAVDPSLLLLLNASQHVGGALGLAIFSAIATSHTSDLLAAHTPRPEALTAGFHRALPASSVFLLAAAVIGTHTKNTRSDAPEPAIETPAELATPVLIGAGAE